jgi:hypothetical protein
MIYRAELVRTGHSRLDAGKTRALGIDWHRSAAVSSRNPRSRTLSRLRTSIDLESEGNRMLELISELFPICRSITGDGARSQAIQFAGGGT